MLLLALVAALTLHGIAPPAARGVDAPATDFSAARALVHVEAVAKVPHPVGSPAHEEVRAYILGVLGGLGLETRVEETRAALKAAGVTHAAHVKNVIARLPGTRPGPAVMLAAHYDSVPQSRGASDDGSGVATLLETARALTVSPRLQNDVIFLFTDAEETAGCGSLAFTTDELAKTPIGVALNFEARGTRGAVALYDTSTDNGALIDAIARAVPRVVSTSLLGSLARALPNDSDATLWKRAGIPTYAFAYVDHVYQYHQYTDSLGALDPRSLQHDGDYALPLTRYLGDQPLPLPRTPSVTYFDVFGHGVVSYSTLVARGLGVVTLGLVAALAWRTRRDEGVTLRGVGVGAAFCCAALVLAGLAAGLVHGALQAALGPFLLLAHPLLATGSGLAIGIAALMFLFAWRAHDGNIVRTVLGALGVWAALLALTVIVAPAASFAFQWPLAFAVAGAWVWLPRRGIRSARVDAALTLTLAPTAFFWSYIAYTLYVMAGGRAPEATVVAVLLATLLTLPILSCVSVRDLRRLGGLLAGASVVIVAVGAISLRVSPGVPRPDSLVYNLYRAQHSASWTTNDPKHDAFVSQRIPAGSRLANADSYDLAPLETHVEAVDEGSTRHGTLHVASPRRARCIGIWEVSHEPITRARVDDMDVVDVVRFSPEIDEKIVRLYTGGRSQSGWVMEYCGADESGFKLELFSPRGKRVRLRILEYADGLPGPPLAPRGGGESYPASDSDVTVAYVDVTL
jgi:hypothetical protein